MLCDIYRRFLFFLDSLTNAIMSKAQGFSILNHILLCFLKVLGGQSSSKNDVKCFYICNSVISFDILRKVRNGDYLEFRMQKKTSCIHSVWEVPYTIYTASEMTRLYLLKTENLISLQSGDELV